jgi:Rrf2 family cysteine metabolism transcriptional repressor
MSLRLSTKGRYGVLAVSRLARTFGSGPVSIKSIAREEHIPKRYLEQLMIRLRRNGLLESIRGPGGGYTLARSPDQISLGEVIAILEGDVTVARCVGIEPKNRCSFEETCVSRIFWMKLSHMIQKVLNNVSFQELIDLNWEEKDIESFLKNEV